MNNNILTFIDFIKEHSIQIPLIQRDYVQGLAPNPKAKEKRDEFVNKLLNAILPDGRPYMLDFIYGARESFDSNVPIQPDAPFLPLDGQQRLTTLFLLHWILAIKTNTEGQYANILELLRKFTYKTRISSDKYCRKILEEKLSLEDSLFEQIENRTWYIGLEKDPTVFAMGEMVKQIENTLAEEPYKSHLQDMASNLFDNDKKCITFASLDMDKYKLTDGLYVKMNARGKELTSFENWKADFINLISTDKSIKDYFTNKDESIKDYFTKRIEHEWNDLFWGDVYSEYAKAVKETTDEKTKKKIKYPRIDEHFMNFFTNFSRLFFFINTTSEEPKAEDFNGNLWSTTENLYGGNNNIWVDLLFNILGVLTEIDTQGGGLNNFFIELFHIKDTTSWDIHSGKVRLFDCNDVNLFRNSFENNNFSWQHVLFYAILKYCLKYKIYTVTDELKIYTRICRDYLLQHNYLDTGDVTIAAQIRVNEMKLYEKAFEYLCSQQDPIMSLEESFTGEDSKYIEAEKEKIRYYKCTNRDVVNLFLKIEDLSYSRGTIGAFSGVMDDCMAGSLLCENVWNAIFTFVNTNALQKVQLFLAYDYEGITIGNDCAYGKRVFMGGEYNGISRWEVHFRKNETNMKRWVISYVDAYKTNTDVSSLIKSERDKISSSPISMRDYMLKYENVLAAWLRNDLKKDAAPFYFAMPNPWKDKDAIVIHSFSNRPLGNAYQTCPMANAVAHGMSHYNASCMNCVGTGSRKEGINIYNGDGSQKLFSLYFGKNNWYVPCKYFQILSPQLQNRLEEGDNEKYRLKAIENKDLIENAIDFLDDVVLELKNKNMIL